jgi:hypothetical protein
VVAHSQIRTISRVLKSIHLVEDLLIQGRRVPDRAIVVVVFVSSRRIFVLGVQMGCRGHAF